MIKMISSLFFSFLFPIPIPIPTPILLLFCFSTDSYVSHSPPPPCSLGQKKGREGEEKRTYIFRFYFVLLLFCAFDLFVETLENGRKRTWKLRTCVRKDLRRCPPAPHLSRLSLAPAPPPSRVQFS